MLPPTSRTPPSDMTALAQEGAQLLDRMPSDDAVGLLESFRDCSSPVAQYVQQLVADAQQQLMTDATRTSIPTNEASLAGDALETRLGCTTAASLMDGAVQAALILEDGDVERQEDFTNLVLAVEEKGQEVKMQELTHDDSNMQDAGVSAQVSPPSGVEGTAQEVVMPDDGRGVQGGGQEVRERVSEKERRGEGKAAHATPMLVRLSSLVSPAVSCLEALTVLEQQVAVAAPRIAAEADQQDDRLGKGLAKKEQKEEGEKDIESDTSLDMAVFLAALEASVHEAVRFAIEGAFAEIEAALEHEREREREQEREQAKEQERQRKELVQVASQKREREREREQEQEQEWERQRNELVQAEAAIQRHADEVVDWAVFRAIAEIQAAREAQREREESNFEWEREAEQEREVEQEMERIRKGAQEREDREKEVSEVEREMERLRQVEREERERHDSEQKASVVIRSRAVEVVDLAICQAIAEIQAAQQEEREREVEQEMKRIPQEEQEREDREKQAQEEQKREDREKEAQILNSRVALYSTYTRALTFRIFVKAFRVELEGHSAEVSAHMLEMKEKMTQIHAELVQMKREEEHEVKAQMDENLAQMEREASNCQKSSTQ